MPVAAGISAAGAIGAAGLGYFGSQGASKAQVQSQNAALQQQAKLFGVLQGAAQPLIDTGKGVLDTGKGVLQSGMDIVNPAASTLSRLLTPGANQTATLSQLPGFQFAQDWGQKATQNLGTTMGLGGNTLKAGADYATGLAQQGFGSLTGMLQNFLGSGINLAGTGGNIIGTGGNVMSSGVGALSGGATNFSSQSSNTLGNIGNAQASGNLGGANALGGGLTGAAGGVTNALLLSKLLKGGGLGPGGVGLGSNAGIYSGATGALY